MLILFKPWSDPRLLREGHASWSDAYSSFVEHCDTRICKIIDNMQVLHKCCNARDDHFVNCAKQARSDCGFCSGADANHLGEILTEELLHEHLQQIKDYQSNNVSTLSATASACLGAVDACGYFSVGEHTMHTESMTDAEICVTGPKDNEMERVWQAAYEQRKLNTKLAFMHDNPTHHLTGETTSQTQISRGVAVDGQLEQSFKMDVDEHSSLLPYVLPIALPIALPLHVGNGMSNIDGRIDIECLASEWRLNKEQALAFHMIVRKSADPHSN